LLLIHFFRSRKNKAIDDRAYLPGEPIHIIALRDLDKLEKKELWQKAQHKKYYSILTEILRTYIDRRYSVSSLEMTTEETLQALLDSGFENDKLFESLRDVLSTADLSKFAKFRPLDSINITAISSARDFINNTCINTEDKDKQETGAGEEVQYG
jgi:hypothetical protein